MPIPAPRNNETDSEFMNRCMGDPTMVSEYPRQDQRAAVCSAQLGKQKAYNPRGWATTDRYRGQFRRKYRPILRDTFDKMSKPLFDIDYTPVSSVIDQLKGATLIKQDEVYKFYKRMIPDVALYFAKLDYRKAKSIAGNEIEVKSPITGLRAKQGEEEQILEDIWMQQFMDFVEQDLGTKIVSVTGQTRDMHINLLEKVLKENANLGMDSNFIELKDKLKEKYILNRRYRLNRIIRTETSFASNHGSLTGMNSTGKNYEKTWIAAMMNTREAHVVANNQTVKKDEYFTVMNEQLLYPCDLHGSAENVINCRCTTSYQIIR